MMGDSKRMKKSTIIQQAADSSITNSNGNSIVNMDRCSICLCELNNKCYTEKCTHLFCFECLKKWTKRCWRLHRYSFQTCPVCRENYYYIFHSFNEENIPKTYIVPGYELFQK